MQNVKLKMQNNLTLQQIGVFILHFSFYIFNS
jgi:hypothetical protein